MYAVAAACAHSCAQAAVGILQLIDKTVAVLDTLADRCPLRPPGETCSWAAVRPTMTPEVATCASVAMLGTIGVLSVGFGSTSTWAVEA
jgi:hypothetical protein